MSSKLEEPVAVGVDGCKGGWIAALCYRRPGGEYATSLERFSDIVELADWRDGFAGEPSVTTDVPMGIPEEVRFRRCDEEARERLGGLPQRRSGLLKAMSTRVEWEQRLPVLVAALGVHDPDADRVDPLGNR